MVDIRIVHSHLSEDYIKKYGNGDIFIETGTYLGDTIYIALECNFRYIHSIELDKELYEQAVLLFNHIPKVKIWNGDSIDCLEELLKGTKSPMTFWLDAHASGPLAGGRSGGSPLLDELRLIKAYGHPDSTIFIDDRRLFGTTEWSYVTEQDCLELLKEINPNYRILQLDGHIEKDILCATTRKEDKQPS